MNYQIKILIVDDYQMMRSLLREALIHAGFSNLTEAVNGQDAYEKITQAHTSGSEFHLIFLDWNMPVMTGLELVQKCKAMDQLKNLSFIMVTAERDKKNIMAALSAGASDFVSKPFSPKQLISKIEKSLEKFKQAS